MTIKADDLVHQGEPLVPPTRVKVSTNGQVSIPAAVRRRWDRSEVIIMDKGDRVIVWPMRSLAELRGSYKDVPGPTTDELRAMDRADDARREGFGP